MTDDARIQRLTALARKAYRNAGLTAVEHEWHDGHLGYEVLGDNEDGLMIFVRSHPRALDALEAALCVMADEPYSVRLEACKKDCEGYWEQHKRALAAEKRIAEFQAQLAQVRECAEEWRNGNQARLVMPRIAAAVLGERGSKE